MNKTAKIVDKKSKKIQIIEICLTVEFIKDKIGV